ncbi:basic leucine zipper transcriptional factor ATF-like 2 [Orycteropus afer afer]|uniref:Basic leucine zipper transcriptional factor ATF-like 2 n=1 Tax=Orycteropus afer afer TaxID=1230840 RepID=A0AC54Z946_ORYAF|nr:basic leucine zipper transcriptional factor ATF-like 2 [Orycteropus afer afer]
MAARGTIAAARFLKSRAQGGHSTVRDAPDPERAAPLPDQAMHLCRNHGLLAGVDPKECQRQLKRKQKNRAAAQRSRQKHTDKADTLHQSLCSVDTASLSAPGPPPGQPGPRGCMGQPSLFQAPVSPTLAEHLPPALQHHEAPGLLTSPVPSKSLAPAAAPAPPAQLPSTTCSSFLGPSLEPRALLPSPPALTAPLQPLGQEHPTGGKLGSSPYSPLAPLGLTRLQSGEPTPAPAFSAADWQGLGVGTSPHPLPAFSLLSSAHICF